MLNINDKLMEYEIHGNFNPNDKLMEHKDTKAQRVNKNLWKTTFL